MSFLAGFLLGVFVYAFARARGEDELPRGTGEVLQTEWPSEPFSQERFQRCDGRLHRWPTQ